LFLRGWLNRFQQSTAPVSMLAILAANYFDPLALPLVAGLATASVPRGTSFVTAFLLRVASVSTVLVAVVTPLHSGGLDLRVRRRQHRGREGG
jgi:hypothetical protein